MNNFQYQCVSMFEKAMEYKKEILIFILAVVASVLLYFGYAYYSRNLTIRAHKEFVEAMRVFDAPLKEEGKRVRLQDLVFDNEVEKWTRASEAFERGYNNHKGSALAGVFLAYQADALLKLAKHDQAIVVLRKAIDILVALELKQAYTLKLALMEIDSSDAVIQKTGIDRLVAIASHEKNNFSDAALYHLGLKFFVEKNFKEAQNYWGQLVVKYGKDQESDKASVFASLAQEKLKLIEI